MSKLGRNDPCHCGSGKKYKKCHLPLEQSVSDRARVSRAATDVSRAVSEATAPFVSELLAMKVAAEKAVEDQAALYAAQASAAQGAASDPRAVETSETPGPTVIHATPGTPAAVPPPDASEAAREERKASDVLLTLAEPVLEDLPEDTPKNYYEFLLKLAMTAWNVELVESQGGKPGDVLEMLPKGDPKALAEIRNLYETLRYRKRALFADDQRFFVSVEVVEEDGKKRVVAATAPFRKP